MLRFNYDDYTVFAELLAEVTLPGILEELPEDVPEHDFSVKFENKMKKLVRQQNMPYYDLIKTAGRRAACIGTAVIVAGGATLSVDAVRDKITEFIVGSFSEHDFITAQSDSASSCPETIETEYEPCVPEGFIFEDDFSVDTPNLIIRSYKGNNRYILFHQYTISSFSSKISTESCKVEYYTDESGIVYTVYHWSVGEGNCDVLWQRDGYAFQLNSDLPLDEVIELCVGIRKK